MPRPRVHALALGAGERGIGRAFAGNDGVGSNRGPADQASVVNPVLNIAKTYPARGPLQQVRLTGPEPFDCFRCGRSKRSKLHTLYNGD